MKITIECKQIVTYCQDVDVTKAEYKLLREYEGIDASERHDKEVFKILSDKLDLRDVFDAEQEFLSILLR